MNAALHGPIATADALQTLKPLGRAFGRIVLREEIGDRAFDHVTEVTACTHRMKVRLIGGDARLWECVRYDNTHPGCGALLTVSYGQHGQPAWTPTEVTR